MASDNTETPPISTGATLQPAKEETKRKVSIITDPPTYGGHDNLGFDGPRRKISQVSHAIVFNAD